MTAPYFRPFVLATAPPFFQPGRVHSHSSVGTFCSGYQIPCQVPPPGYLPYPHQICSRKNAPFRSDFRTIKVSKSKSNRLRLIPPPIGNRMPVRAQSITWLSSTYSPLFTHPLPTKVFFLCFYFCSITWGGTPTPPRIERAGTDGRTACRIPRTRPLYGVLPWGHSYSRLSGRTSPRG